MMFVRLQNPLEAFDYLLGMTELPSAKERRCRVPGSDCVDGSTVRERLMRSVNRSFATFMGLFSHDRRVGRRL